MTNFAKFIEKPTFTKQLFDSTHNYGRFVIEPLERGFGQTLGNSLRRVLLSSLPGFAVCAIEVNGARHEFSSLDGVEEDVTAIVLNLKDLVLTIDDETDKPQMIKKVLEIDAKGPKTVTAGDLVVPFGVNIINPDLVIAHVADGGQLTMRVHVNNGRGYSTSENNKVSRITSPKIGLVFTDSNYSPVTKVSYSIEPTRVGHDSRYDQLTLEIWTNGSILPHQALSMASRILIVHFQELIPVEDQASDITILGEPKEVKEKPYYNTPISDLVISVRAYNALKRYGIETIGELVDKTYEEMVKIRNLGKKSLKEIEERLAELGLYFRES